MCSACYTSEAKSQHISPLSVNEVTAKAMIVQAPAATTTSSEDIEENKQQIDLLATRCSKCKVRVGYLGYQCKCGSVYCAKHRHFDQHECSYNFKLEGKEKIFKSNPVVEQPKLKKL